MPEDADPDQSIVVALGSNLPGRFGDSQWLLEAALQVLAADAMDVLAVSSWWRSTAWPDPAAPPFLNGVALGRSDLAPDDLLAVLRRIETAFGRTRDAPNASRTLDLDLIACGRIEIDRPGLVVPHPRARERQFVMGPLAEIAPGWRHPTSGETARELAAQSSVGQDSAPVAQGHAALHKSSRVAI